MRDLRKIQKAITEMRTRLDESMGHLAHSAVRATQHDDAQYWAKRAHYQNLAISRLTEIAITEMFFDGDDLQVREAATRFFAEAKASRAAEAA